MRGWGGGGAGHRQAVAVGDRACRARRARAAPGVRMPTRLSGSAAAIPTSSPVRSRRRVARSASTASGSAYCSPTKPVTKRPPRAVPRASRRRSAQRISRQGRARRFAREQVAEHDAPAREQLLGHRLGQGLGSGAVARRRGRGSSAQRPSPAGAGRGRAGGGGGRARAPRACAQRSRAVRSARTLREAVGGDEAARDEVPERVLDLHAEPAGARRELVVEQRAPRSQGLEHARAAPSPGAAAPSPRAAREPPAQVVRGARTRSASRATARRRRRPAGSLPGGGRRRSPGAWSAGPTPPRPTGTASSSHSGR